MSVDGTIQTETGALLLAISRCQLMVQFKLRLVHCYLPSVAAFDGTIQTETGALLLAISRCQLMVQFKLRLVHCYLPSVGVS